MTAPAGTTYLRPLILVDHGLDLAPLFAGVRSVAEPSARYDLVHVCVNSAMSLAMCGWVCIPVYDPVEAELAGATLLHDAVRRLPADASVHTTLLLGDPDPVPRLRELIRSRSHDVVITAAPRRAWWWGRPSTVERWLAAQSDVDVLRIGP
jgi:hypothetical protein